MNKQGGYIKVGSTNYPKQLSPFERIMVNLDRLGTASLTARHAVGEEAARPGAVGIFPKSVNDKSRV